MKIHAGDIEIAVARYFGWRQNLVVPNVSWGLGLRHEADMIVLTSANYAWEVEIKISASDLKADDKKRHGHNHRLIRRLYFAVPLELKDMALDVIPQTAGLLAVGETTEMIRRPKDLCAQRLTDAQVLHLHKLAAMRIWSLKERLYAMMRSIK